MKSIDNQFVIHSQSRTIYHCGIRMSLLYIMTKQVIY